MQRPGESRTSPRRLSAKERQLQALELRKTGMGYREIGATLGYRDRAGGPHKAVMAAIRTILREPVEEVVTLECERLDAMLMALWPAIVKGETTAIQRGLGIMERRARLLGLDAPQRFEHAGPDGTAIVLRWESDADA